jgi:hypothetical protein
MFRQKNHIQLKIYNTAEGESTVYLREKITVSSHAVGHHVQNIYNIQNSTHKIFISRFSSGRGVKLTTHLRLVPRLRMSRAIPLLHLYVSMVRTGKFYIFT